MSEDSLLNISNNTYKNSPEERQKFEPHFSKLTDAKTSSCFQSIPSSHTADISNLAESMLKRYTNFVVIGIGGSSMGGRALVEMTGAQHIRFLDNIDSKEFSDLWTEVSIDQHQLKKTAWIVISKSGSSIEILWNYNFIHDLYSENGLNLIEQSFFISEIKDNPLSRLARQHQRPLLEIPEVVGGRFSVLTPVGLLIAALCGWNIDDMVSGAHEARKNKDLILQSCVLFNQALQEKKPMTLFWFYHSRFRWFGGWLQQLWAESLGKKINRSGQPAPAFSTPVIAIGACDQHSILQQVVDGPKDKLVCIFRFQDVEKSSHQLKTPLFKEIDFLRHRPYGELIQAEAIATQQGLSESGVSSELFTMQSTDARGLGFLFMYFQLVVATLGESADINSFDQPGVALGKKITLSILQQN